MNKHLVCALRPGPGRPSSLFRHLRSFSSRSTPKFTLHATAPTRPPRLSTRPLSLFNSQPTIRHSPPPSLVASVSLLEADANDHPHDVPKHLALYEALVASGVHQGYELVTIRWERMCEFDPENPLLANDRAFELYLFSLKKLNLQDSFPSAVRRRDRILKEFHPSVATATPLAQESASNQTQPTTDSTSPSTSSDLARHVLSQSSPSPSLLNPLPIQPNSTQPNLSTLSLAQAQKSGSTSTWNTTSPGLFGLGSLFGRNSPGGAGAAGMTGVGAGVSGAGAGGPGGPGNPISVIVQEPKGSWIPRLIRFIVLTALGGFFILVILSILLENSGLLKAGPRQAEFQPTQGKTYKFSDVHGVDEAKEELRDVVEFLKDPTAFASLGGKLPKGVLLTGEPGTGKTMLARAVAGEAGVPFLFASGSEFDEMFVGVGAKRVRELFASARKKAPSIIFIDELDAIGGKRTNRESHYMKQTLNQLLVEMDGFEQGEGVVVIAATNFMDSLDPALVRPGRFDRLVAVPLPDVRGRAQILQHHMKPVTVSPDVDLTILARGTPGFSGADLQNMVNQAAIQASKERAKEVTLKHLEWAKDRIIMGAERKSSYIDERVKKLTAYHEGGHALVALYTEGAMPLHKVTCMPRGHALGVTSQLPEGDRHSVSLKEYLAEIDVCMGGRVAEELIFGPENVTSGAVSDLRHATGTASMMVKNFGYSQKVGPVYYSDRDETISPQKKEEIEDEVRTLLKAGESRVIALLKSKESELHRLATALIEYETLDLEEVKKVIKGEKIRDIKEVMQEDIERISGAQQRLTEAHERLSPGTQAQSS